MKKHMLKNMVVVGAAALALAASTIVVPSVADAAGVRPSGHGMGHARGHVGGNFRGRGGPRGYNGGYNSGYYGGYYGGYCGPIQITLGLCGPYGY
ncbi:MAG: hypothetical protein ABR878_10405 [Roseiarcus sp.]